LFVNRQSDEAPVGEGTKGNGDPREKERAKVRAARDGHAREERASREKQNQPRCGIYLSSRKKTRECFFPASGSAAILERGEAKREPFAVTFRDFLRKTILDTRAFSLDLSRRV